MEAGVAVGGQQCEENSDLRLVGSGRTGLSVAGRGIRQTADWEVHCCAAGSSWGVRHGYVEGDHPAPAVGCEPCAY